MINSEEKKERIANCKGHLLYQKRACKRAKAGFVCSLVLACASLSAFFGIVIGGTSKIIDKQRAPLEEFKKSAIYQQAYDDVESEIQKFIAQGYLPEEEMKAFIEDYLALETAKNLDPERYATIKAAMNGGTVELAFILALSGIFAVFGTVGGVSMAGKEKSKLKEAKKDFEFWKRRLEAEESVKESEEKA